MGALSELHPIFHPRAVALIGASSGEGKVGRMFMERFLEAGFEKLYPVNPREREIFGVEACPSLAEIPEPIDISCRDFSTNPYVNAFFASPKDIVEAVYHSSELRDSGPERKRPSSTVPEPRSKRSSGWRSGVGSFMMECA